MSANLHNMNLILSLAKRVAFTSPEEAKDSKMMMKNAANAMKVQQTTFIANTQQEQYELHADYEKFCRAVDKAKLTVVQPCQ